MIAFCCSSCQKKLSVQEALAGKKVRCPGCGQIILVPVPVPVTPGTQVTVPLPPMPVAPGKQPSASEALTQPPSGDPDATEGAAAPGAAAGFDLAGMLTPPQSPDELGRLGKYCVLKVLGQGGMGVVFLAEDPKLKRKVAIKAMLPGLAANASAGARFLREAQAMAAVEHDNVATVFQVDEERGVPFLAMEFLKGGMLEERLRREGKLPLRDMLRIGREIAEGLGAAHETGLIHRDIKPANVWLEAPKGRVKILDFGLARAASQDSGLTQEGAIVGTPAYMAPEQGRGEAVEARCDVFSLGCVLYRMATGRMPFKGKDTVSTLMAVAMDQPEPPCRVDAAVPQGLSELVMRLLEKDPARRPESAGEVAEELRALEAEPSGGEATVQVRRPPWASGARVGRRKLVLLAAGLLVLLVGGGVLAMLLLRDQSPKGTPTTDSRTADTEVGDPDRRAAEWVLSIGGMVWVNEQEREVKAAADLPRDSFRLTGIGLLGNQQVTDAGLAHCRGCKNLKVIILSNTTTVSDAGLAHLKDSKNLTDLYLGSTQVTDAGLAYFKDCKNLVS